MRNNSKFNIQEAQYEFPYHYLPQMDKCDCLRLHRHLPWGLEYMSYMSFLIELIKQSDIKSLLDIGCGDGRLIHMIKSDVPLATGADLSAPAIAFARAFNPTVEFVLGDFAAIKRKYEWITLIEVLEHIPDEQMAEFIRNAAHLLQDNGRLLISVPTVNVPLNKKHYRHYSLDLLKTTIEPYFEVEEHWWIYRKGIRERIIRKILSNKFYVLNYSPLLDLLWRMHKRKTYYADASTGVHLVCLARPLAD